VAKKPEPREVPAIVTVDGEREKTVALLSQHFAQDNLSLEEFERRVEAVYQTSSVPALRELTRDLVADAPAASSSLAPAAPKAGAVAEYPLEHERITSIMSETKRKGAWQVAQLLTVWSMMSETTLDLTQAVLQPGVTEIRLSAVMASVKVIVPPGVRVVLQAGSLMGSVSDETVDPPAVGSGAPVVRITGRVIMSELVARVRRRELTEGDEGDD
jgi:hypothetical protein